MKNLEIASKEDPSPHRVSIVTLSEVPQTPVQDVSAVDFKALDEVFVSPAPFE
jgi:hypothetical protein